MTYLYHGTVLKNLNSICSKGFLPFDKTGRRIWHQWRDPIHGGIFGSVEGYVYFFANEDDAYQYAAEVSQIISYKELFPKRKSYTYRKNKKLYPELEEKVSDHSRRTVGLKPVSCRIDFDKLPKDCVAMDDPEDGTPDRVAVKCISPIPPNIIECAIYEFEGPDGGYWNEYKKCKRIQNLD